MKKIIYLAVIVLGLAGSVGFARPSADVLADNFEKCDAADSTWYQRFGQYVVAFDINRAAEACVTNLHQAQTPEMARCKVEGRWVNAGYYCRDIY